MRFPFPKDVQDKKQTFDDRDMALRYYWRYRLWLHHYEHYKGRGLAKFPEDLRTYEHIIWATQPEVIVELGGGTTLGSAIWFADRLDTLCGGGEVITLELQPPDVDQGDPRVLWIQCDLRDEDVVNEVSGLVDGRRAMVIEDSAHDYDTTIAALRLYSPLVQAGQFFIVEDGVVDEPDLVLEGWEGAGGVQPAIEDFLKEESRFVRRDFDLYGLTMHMGGWLEAT